MKNSGHGGLSQELHPIWLYGCSSLEHILHTSDSSSWCWWSLHYCCCAMFQLGSDGRVWSASNGRLCAGCDRSGENLLCGTLSRNTHCICSYVSPPRLCSKSRCGIHQINYYDVDWPVASSRHCYMFLNLFSHATWVFFLFRSGCFFALGPVATVGHMKSPVKYLKYIAKEMQVRSEVDIWQSEKTIKIR